MKAHPTAIISPEAELADDVELGPNCYIDRDVRIGEGSVIQMGAHITGRTTIGRNCQVFPYAVIGIAPQDLKYAGEPTEVTIGDNNVIREFVTIHRGTAGGGGTTRIGNNNLLMAYSHVAHDCQVGSNVALANVASLAGHIEIHDNAVLGGLVGVHQFSQIGAYAIIGGCSAVDRDVIPFAMAAGNRASLHGLNVTGLRRAGFSADEIRMLKDIYHLLFTSGLDREKALARIEDEFGEHEQAKYIIDFVTRSKRGLCTPQ